MSETETMLDTARELTMKHFGSDNPEYILSVAQVLSINNAMEQITKAIDNLTAITVALGRGSGEG
jgi:hypothetical protein